MSPRPWTMVMLRLIGLVLIVVSIPPTWWVVHRTVQGFAMGNGFDRLSPFVEYGRDDEIADRLGWVVLLGLGFYLFLRGRWVLRRCLRGLDGSCPSCGYDTQGLTVSRCPECGARIQAP